MGYFDMKAQYDPEPIKAPKAKRPAPSIQAPEPETPDQDNIDQPDDSGIDTTPDDQGELPNEQEE